jgi:hypothetical protein
MRQIDITDERRTAETILAIPSEEIPSVVSNLTKAKRLSAAVKNLNRLTETATDRELGWRALRHLGFSDA